MANAKQSQRWRRGLIIPEPDFILGPGDVLISLTVPPTWSHADLVREIGRELGLPVDPLPSQLESMKSSRSYTVFGPAAKELDEITAQYENLYWSSRDGVLRFAFIQDGADRLSDFDTLAGRLMLEARPQPSGRLSKDQWLAIARELDKHRFAPLDYVEPAQKQVLTDYNKGDRRVHIHSWETAFSVNGWDGAKVVRAVKQRLNRACERYRQSQIFRDRS